MSALSHGQQPCMGRSMEVSALPPSTQPHPCGCLGPQLLPSSCGLVPPVSLQASPPGQVWLAQGWPRGPDPRFSGPAWGAGGQCRQWSGGKIRGFLCAALSLGFYSS